MLHGQIPLEGKLKALLKALLEKCSESDQSLLDQTQRSSHGLYDDLCGSLLTMVGWWAMVCMLDRYKDLALPYLFIRLLAMVLVVVGFRSGADFAVHTTQKTHCLYFLRSCVGFSCGAEVQ